jgi:hypothetical protein
VFTKVTPFPPQADTFLKWTKKSQQFAGFRSFVWECCLDEE